MKTMLSRFWVMVLTAACVVGIGLPASAQVDKGRITGVVQDQSNANVMGATVTATNDKTGDVRTAVTGEDGAYVIAPVVPSFYTLRVTAEGFGTSQITNLQVAVGQELKQNFTLRVGAVNAEVTVTSVDEVPIDTTSARIGLNITQREVGGLPLNGRQLSQLYLQAPGALNSGTGTFQDIRFSGRSVEQNAIRYDGVEGSAIVDASPGNLNGEVPSPFKLQSSLENVQEFRVESNNYPAEYGTGDGGQVSVVTKSGGNAFHGSGYEYFRNDALDAKNTFDLAGAKSKLRLNQFGGSIGGPIVKDKVFFFGYYEGYRLSAGQNNIESVPTARFSTLPDCAPGTSFSASNQCIYPAIRQLLPGFVGPGAVRILADTNTGTLGNSDLDIYQLPGIFTVRENSAGGRLDLRLNSKNSMYVRYFRDQGTNNYPEGITGRKVFIHSVPQNAAASVTTMLTSTLINEAKIGYNSALTRINGTAPIVNGIDFSRISINTTGSIAAAGIPGQGNSAGLAVPGGLVRQNSATNGVGAPYTPYTVSFIDNLAYLTGIHSFKFGTEVRMVRMYTDRLGGTTYSFSNLSNFMSANLSSVDDLVDVSQPSPYNLGATGGLLLKQEYYIGYAQDEIKVRPNLTFNLGLRYEYYTPLREDQNRFVLFDLANGTLYNTNFCQGPPSFTVGASATCLKQDVPWFKASASNFGPRVGVAWSPMYNHAGLFGGDHTVLRAGFGIYYGPGQVEDQLQPAESDRIWTTPSGGSTGLPVCGVGVPAPCVSSTNNASASQTTSFAFYCGQATTCATSTANLTANFLANPTNRSARVRAYTNDYTVPERIYQYSMSWQQQWGKFVSTVAYVGSQGRNLFQRSVGNRIVSVRTNTANGNAVVVRQFSIDQGGNTVLNPYAEIDYKTSGGYDSYNALQIQLMRRFGAGLSLSTQYTMAKSWGTSGGSNEAVTASNPFDFSQDLGYNAFDVRHNFNVSLLYQLPFGRGQSGIAKGVLGNWEVGTIINARSGVPVPVQITRPDVIFVGRTGTTVAGQYFNSAQVVGGVILTDAIINTPGGGNSRNVRRPDVVPGVPQFLPNGNINPAAFAIPLPGTFGNLVRNSVHGPGFAQADLILVKRIPIHESISAEFRTEIFNVFNHPNFANPPAQLGNILPSGPGANFPQPGQAYSSSGANSAGAFGKIVSTVGTTVGIGTNRQIQFAVRLNF